MTSIQKPTNLLKVAYHQVSRLLYHHINNINLDDHFDENDPDTIILIRFLARDTKFEKPKRLKVTLMQI